MRILSICLLFISCITSATPIAKISSILHTMKSMRADFTQQLLDKNGKPTQQLTGKMVILKPGRFKWEVLTPDEMLILITDNKIINFDKILEQVLIQDVNGQKHNLPIMQLLLGEQNFTQDFIVQDIKCQSAQCFMLTPKHDNVGFNEAILGFDEHKLTYFKLLDSLGQNTVFLFKNIKLNVTVDPDEFKFKIPVGVDIISELE